LPSRVLGGDRALNQGPFIIADGTLGTYVVSDIVLR